MLPPVSTDGGMMFSTGPIWLQTGTNGPLRVRRSNVKVTEAGVILGGLTKASFSILLIRGFLVIHISSFSWAFCYEIP